MYWIIFSENF